MSEATHTPGRWDISRRTNGDDGWVILSEEGYGIGVAWDINGRPQNNANARLIAAAPDLLEASEPDTIGSAARSIEKDYRAGKPVIETIAEVGGWEAPVAGSERYRMLDAALAARGSAYRSEGGRTVFGSWAMLPRRKVSEPRIIHIPLGRGCCESWAGWWMPKLVGAWSYDTGNKARPFRLEVAA